MWLFLIKTIVTVVMFYLVFCFYGNINDGLFIKGFFCIVFMLFVYWVDIYRLTRIFSAYYLACRYYKQQNYTKAFVYFQRLLDYSFAPSLPYLALMRFKGLGCEANAKTALYYSERAMRNGYNDCLFLVAVIDFFGESLTSYFKEQQQSNGTTNTNIDKASSEQVHQGSNQSSYIQKRTVHKNNLEPDYKSCVFHLKQYLNEILSGQNKDAKYVAEANALLGYCIANGLGAEMDFKCADEYFAKAKALKSANVDNLLNCLQNKKQVNSFII